MRYLNKIVFINSAAIRYSEVQLDGNIHLIGTQGVGKSTILRAILFFYNADTQRLGIPVEKKSYQDYYFPYADSSIIYEVAREDGWFTVLSYKTMNRICYRFIASPSGRIFLSTRRERLIRRIVSARCSIRTVSSIAGRSPRMRNTGISSTETRIINGITPVIP